MFWIKFDVRKSASLIGCTWQRLIKGSQKNTWKTVKERKANKMMKECGSLESWNYLSPRQSRLCACITIINKHYFKYIYPIEILFHTETTKLTPFVKSKLESKQNSPQSRFWLSSQINSHPKWKHEKITVFVVQTYICVFVCLPVCCIVESHHSLPQSRQFTTVWRVGRRKAVPAAVDNSKVIRHKANLCKAF